MPTSNIVLDVSGVTALQALKVSNIADGTVINISGYHTRDDGGQGTCIYSSSSAATDNGGTVTVSVSIFKKNKLIYYFYIFYIIKITWLLIKFQTYNL